MIKRYLSILFVPLIVLAVIQVHGQAPGNTYFGPQGDEKTITVSGCVREGVECLTFVPFSGHEKYSLVSGSKLEIGSAYQITASIVDVSICQAGKALKPIEVKKLDRKCS
jgi:hypothetical protein